MKRLWVIFALQLCALGPLAGCSDETPNVRSPPGLAGYYGPETAPKSGTVLGDQGLLVGVGHGKSRSSDAPAVGLGVNAYLWRGALDTLSFMPLASADPFGGVIITDWYAPPGDVNERFKATAYILGRELRTDAIRLSLFRQVRQDGQWLDAPVSPTTVGEITDKILARARQIKVQTAQQ